MCFGTVLIMPAKPSPPQNHLLAALPAEVQGRLLPYLYNDGVRRLFCASRNQQCMNRESD